MPSRDRGDDENALLGIDIIGADDIWAVGEYNSGLPPTETGRRTLAQHWDGTRWRIVRSPNPGGLDLPNRLYAVLASVRGRGVGGRRAGLAGRSLILRYDGAKWRPVQNNCGGRLRGITDVPGTSPLWAVGENTTCWPPNGATERGHRTGPPNGATERGWGARHRRGDAFVVASAPRPWSKSPPPRLVDGGWFGASRSNRPPPIAGGG